VAAIMMSGYDDPSLVQTALEVGAYDYLVKPFKHSDVLIGVSNALHRKALELENRLHRDHLEQLVSERTAALERVLKQLERSADRMARSREETIRRLSRAVEYRDEETGNHVERMSRYCELLAENVDYNGVSMRLASPMHDVGKIAVHDGILLKPGKLTAEEWAEMQRHCQVGYDILSESGSKLLDLAASIALTHHEKYDGTGYPHGLAGGEIPLEGRIAAVADVFDALTSDRVYRPAFAMEAAIETMRQGRGSHFDPVILDAFIDDLDHIVEIKQSYDD
jgi:putative two-component system response regulator